MDKQAEREFTEFVAARSPTLMRTARLLSGDRHRAEDLVQAALAKLASRWRRVDDPEAYVRRIIYHDQVSWWRRKGLVQQESTAQLPDSPVADGSPHVDRRLDVQAALSRLAPRQRAVLVLRYFEDLPERDIADLLGCTTGTVRSQAHRALARLRELAPELADTPVPTATRQTKE